MSKLLRRGYGFRVTWDIPGPKTIFAEILVDGKRSKKDNDIVKVRKDKAYVAIEHALEQAKEDIIKFEISERVTLIVGFTDDETKGEKNKPKNNKNSKTNKK